MPMDNANDVEVSSENANVSNDNPGDAQPVRVTKESDEQHGNRKQKKLRRRRALNTLQKETPTRGRRNVTRKKRRKNSPNNPGRLDGCLEAIGEFFKTFVPIFLLFVVLPIGAICLIEGGGSGIAKVIGWAVILSLSFFGVIMRFIRIM